MGAVEKRRYWTPKESPWYEVANGISEYELIGLRKSIKESLVDNKLTIVWLVNRLEAVGIPTDKSEISAILSGSRKGPKVDTILIVSDKILRKYAESARGG